MGCLGAGNTRQPVYQAQCPQHQQALAQGADVAQVARWDDDPVRRLPIELLRYLNADSLLSFHPQRVHRVCQIDGLIRGNLAHNAHAAIKVGIQYQCAMRWAAPIAR